MEEHHRRSRSTGLSEFESWERVAAQQRLLPGAQAAALQQEQGLLGTSLLGAIPEGNRNNLNKLKHAHQLPICDRVLRHGGADEQRCHNERDACSLD